MPHGKPVPASRTCPSCRTCTVYVERLAALTVGKTLDGMRIASPFVLRTVSPSPRELHGAKVETVERLGKRIVIGVDGDRFLVIHLMIAGRLRWKKRGEKVPGKVGLAAFDFPNGTLIFTEASPKKRASLHLVAGRAALAEFDRGGLDVDRPRRPRSSPSGCAASATREALAHRSDAVQRHRQRVLRRDPARAPSCRRFA